MSSSVVKFGGQIRCTWCTCNLQQLSSPVFVRDSLLPPSDKLPSSVAPPVLEKLRTKRFVFEASKIASLRAKVGAGLGVLSPSRVEVVVAVILKVAMAASRTVTGSSSSRSSVLFQAVNLRRRMSPALPMNTIGNLFWMVPVVITETESEDLKTMVHKMKEAVNEFSNVHAGKFSGQEGLSVISDFSKVRVKFKDMERFNCTSWCKVPFYGADFGWGKPLWVSSSSVAFKNTVVLVDTKDGGGIEAWVSLEEQNMSIFEHNLMALISDTKI